MRLPLAVGISFILSAGWFAVARAQNPTPPQGELAAAKSIVELRAACAELRMVDAGPTHPPLPPEAWRWLGGVGAVMVLAWFWTKFLENRSRDKRCRAEQLAAECVLSVALTELKKTLENPGRDLSAIRDRFTLANQAFETFVKRNKE